MHRNLASVSVDSATLHSITQDYSMSPHRMNSRLKVSFLHVVLASILSMNLAAQESHQSEKWTPQDLLFSEALSLPGYSRENLGKLEYPAIASDRHGTVFVVYDFTDEVGREGIYLNSFDSRTIRLQSQSNLVC